MSSSDGFYTLDVAYIHSVCLHLLSGAAGVIEWASGVSLSPEQVNDCFVAGEHVWKVNDEKLALLGEPGLLFELYLNVKMSGIVICG